MRRWDDAAGAHGSGETLPRAPRAERTRRRPGRPGDTTPALV